MSIWRTILTVLGDLAVCVTVMVVMIFVVKLVVNLLLTASTVAS